VSEKLLENVLLGEVFGLFLVVQEVFKLLHDVIALLQQVLLNADSLRNDVTLHRLVLQL
jgi:hypothetical protein